MPSSFVASECIKSAPVSFTAPTHADLRSFLLAVKTEEAISGAVNDSAAEAAMASMGPPGSPPMPWCGMDIGGTLTKLVYFEPADDDGGHARPSEEKKLVASIRHYLTTNKAYGDSGHRDTHLQMDGAVVNGRSGALHFVRFPTSQMGAFIDLAKEKGMARLASTVCATGGGAYKFEAAIQAAVKMKLHKFDEVDSLIRGVEFMETHREEPMFI